MRRLMSFLLFVCMTITVSVSSEGLLPSLTSAYGVSMPSMIETMFRYPDAEEKKDDGTAVETWKNVSEDQFYSFGVFLADESATLLTYTVTGNVFDATVSINGQSFYFSFDTGEQSAKVRYPAGTHDGILFEVQSIWSRAEEAESAGQYALAASLYASLVRYGACKVPYRDSDQRELRCYYKEGEAKREAKDWDGAVAAFKQAGSYSDATTQITETHYRHANALNAEGQYEDAYALYMQITGYSDVDTILAALAFREARLAPFKTVGGYVTFGQYEQDNNKANGAEEIEWLVLEYDEANNRALLISRYALDAKPYNTEYTDITWEQCTLRSWLNGEFFRAAFSSEEQAAIITTDVDNSSSQGFRGNNTRTGNNTRDKIFLLSYTEAWFYFNSTEDRRCAPTAYAVARGGSTSSYEKMDGKATGWWWLRSLAYNQNYGLTVISDGTELLERVDQSNNIVRPAFWINLDAEVF